MATNTGLTGELAEKLLRGQPVICPHCGVGELAARYRHKLQRTEYKCTVCGEIFRPAKLI